MPPHPRRPIRLPRALRVLGRLVGLPVVEVRAYWGQESRAIRAGTAALAIGLGATVLAGVVLAAAADRLVSIPGMLALIPAAIGMRGSIFGALGSRLGTGILTGQFEPGLTRGGYLRRQLEASALLSVTSSTQAGMLAWAISAALGVRTSLLDLVAISLVGGLLSSLVLAAVVVGMAQRAHAARFSMDDVGAPVVTATGDLVTLPALLAASFLVSVPALAATLGALGLAAGLVAAVVGIRRREPTIRRVVRESLVVLTVAVTIDVLAGVVVEERAGAQLGSAALLVLLPPFIASCGSLGGMLSSRLASKLHVGLLEPRRLPGKLAVLDVSLLGLLALLAFAGVGLAGWLAATLTPGVTALPLVRTLGVTLLAGLAAFPILSLTAYAAAATSFRHGLDPDTHSIPIVTATMDLAGVLCLVGAITLLQAGST